MKSVIPLLVLGVIAYALYQGVMASRSKSSESKSTSKLPATVQHPSMSIPQPPKPRSYQVMHHRRIVDE
jgi:hypothetical protein